MASSPTPWKYYHHLRPDELADAMKAAPIAFWPLGLIEHHGWHLPIGYDGVKAERICIRIAEDTGGLMLPTMWWGALGGHGDFAWTHYQPESAAADILTTTTRQLIQFGFRIIVLLGGHYPWEGILEENIPAIESQHPDTLILFGSERTICGDLVDIPGEHAAKEETSFGLHLFPELVDMDALTPGRDDSVWPGGKDPQFDDAFRNQFIGLSIDPNDPLFAQSFFPDTATDATAASVDYGLAKIDKIVDHLTQRINNHDISA
ncbi:MAG: hypothetical protein CMJ49_00460 [Planctomycetaceae bacterium]|nr:hypothetical protein [Planctomycetaceae bacterium]